MRGGPTNFLPLFTPTAPTLGLLDAWDVSGRTRDAPTPSLIDSCFRLRWKEQHASAFTGLLAADARFEAVDDRAR